MTALTNTNRSLYLKTLEWLFPGTDLDALTRENSARILGMQKTTSAHFTLVNDFYSWNREKLGPEDRRRNCMDLIMKLYNLDEATALNVLKGMIIDVEKQIKEYMYGVQWCEGQSSQMIQYMETLMYMASGHAFWATTAPRYCDPEFFVPLKTDLSLYIDMIPSS
jgi:hypothetical protein